MLKVPRAVCTAGLAAAELDEALALEEVGFGLLASGNVVAEPHELFQLG